MNVHKNARTTLHSRALMVSRVLDDGRSPVSVAADFGISERTVYKWLARAAKELERLGPRCPRGRVEPGCSAVRLMMDDYGDLRARVRAGRGAR